jgi:DNA-directed RNA polymerase specialized sigma24 family protein
VANAYRVRATRWARGWELHIDDAEHGEIGVTTTKGHDLAGAAAMVRDYLTVVYDLDEAEAEAIVIEVSPDLGPEAAERMANMRELAATAAAAQTAAATASRETVAFLAALGLNGREIATVLGLSAQRVSQLLKPAE